MVHIALVSVRHTVVADHLVLLSEGAVSNALLHDLLKEGYVIGKNDGNYEPRISKTVENELRSNQEGHEALKFTFGPNDQPLKQHPDIVIYRKLLSTIDPWILEIKCFSLFGTKKSANLNRMDDDLDKVLYY